MSTSSSPVPDALGNAAPIPDDVDHPDDLPLTMSASVVLTSLPDDAHTALENAQLLEQKKVTVRFKAVGSAPILRTQVFKISASQRFETVVNFLRTRLKCKPTDSVFLYVNSVFAPSLDEVVGNLFSCFKSDDQLIIAYSMTPAFG
ncbi:MAG: Ubiquitin-like protein [Candelina mexicana]|nr:MAG: Ubiquitin-like protein [Candelina mexicana]